MRLVTSGGGSSTSTPSAPSAAFASGCTATASAHTAKCRTTLSTMSPVESSRSRGGRRWDGEGGHNKGSPVSDSMIFQISRV